MDHYFTPTLSVTNKEAAIADWVLLIGSQSLPMSVVEGKACREFHGKDKVVSRRAARVFTLYLAEAIEEIISEEMAEASQGQAECGTWTKAGYHCVAIFSRCNKKMKMIVSGTHREEQLPHLAFLAVSTLSKEDPTTGK